MYEVAPVQLADLGSQVAGELRSLIVRGDMPPGTRLVETALASLFDVSRGPIRDALRTLQSEGLIEVRKRNAYVRGLKDEDISELYSLRSSLESLAVRMTSENRATVTWAPFDRAVDAMRAAADRSDPEAFAVADLEFHTHLYEASEHKRLAAMWAQILPTFSELLKVTIAQDADLHPSADSHATILQFCRSGDVDAVLGELTAHLEQARDRLTNAYRQVRASNEAIG